MQIDELNPFASQTHFGDLHGDYFSFHKFSPVISCHFLENRHLISAEMCLCSVCVWCSKLVCTYSALAWPQLMYVDACRAAGGSAGPHECACNVCVCILCSLQRQILSCNQCDSTSSSLVWLPCVCRGGAWLFCMNPVLCSCRMYSVNCILCVRCTTVQYSPAAGTLK